MSNIKVGNRFEFNSPTPTPYGKRFEIEVININDFREPSMRYGVDIRDQNGLWSGDIKFHFYEEEMKNEKTERRNGNRSNNCNSYCNYSVDNTYCRKGK